MRESFMRCANRSVFWVEHSEMRPNSFVGYVQVFTDKTATVLNSIALDAHPVRVVRLNFLVPFRRWLNGNRPTAVELLPSGEGRCELHEGKSGESERSSRYWFIGTAFVDMEDGSCRMTNCEVRKVHMSVLYEVMANMLRPSRSAAEAFLR